jgi:hypothetical protein
MSPVTQGDDRKISLRDDGSQYSIDNGIYFFLLQRYVHENALCRLDQRLPINFAVVRYD